ncbi:hypothetical protein KM043_010285 [Ampulex compressa]|nr:hypothetical protein KM043_010285 [Ampulex compressa]
MAKIMHCGSEHCELESCDIEFRQLRFLPSPIGHPSSPPLQPRPDFGAERGSSNPDLNVRRPDRYPRKFDLTDTTLAHIPPPRIFSQLSREKKKNVDNMKNKASDSLSFELVVLPLFST